MKGPGTSWKTVQYDLRPAKQVERRMLIDGLQLLGLSGFPIRDYKYVGMGSIYFVDYILFHRLLGMNRMLSVELSEKIKKRVKFNKPFDFIEMESGSIGDQIPLLSRDVSHVLWLDYDSIFFRAYVEDLTSACELSRGSIILVTVDVEPPGNEGDGPAEWREYFIAEAGDYLPPSESKDFARSKLPNMNLQILNNVIRSAISSRADVEYIPLFNFLYRDGHQMLTIGGMIGGPAERRKIEQGDFANAVYSRMKLEDPPFEIRIPRLTRKERLLLDAKMPCLKGWKPSQFEIDAADISDYMNVYRFLPSYAELML